VKKLILDRRLSPFYKGLPDDTAPPPRPISTYTTTASSSTDYSNPESPTTSSIPTRNSNFARSNSHTPASRRTSGSKNSLSSLGRKKGNAASSELEEELDLNELYRFPVECPICFLVSL